MHSSAATSNSLTPAVLIAGLLVLYAGSVARGGSPVALAPVVVGMVLILAFHETLLRWRSLVAATVLVILFVPIRRYVLPSSLPFELEPYRVVVAMIALLWLSSLLIDPRVQLRKSQIDAPILLFVVAIIGSLAMNAGRFQSVASKATKEVLFFASFLIVFYLLVSVVRRVEDATFLTKILVGGGTIVAFFSILETRTGYNVFDHLQPVIPFVEIGQIPDISASTDNRGARPRAYGSAQHAIALGALLVMLIPLAVVLAKHLSRKWWLAVALLAPGAMSSVSRTTVLMFVGMFAALFWLRPTDVKRYWPAIIPVVILIHFAVPGTLGSLKSSFFPEGGLIAQQTRGGSGAGRVASLGPALRDEFGANPLLGKGFGTRAVTSETVTANAKILDNQWLGLLVETGLVGTFAFLWLIVRLLRTVRVAARVPTLRGDLLAAIAGAVVAFGAGMFLFDAFSFIQVTFIFFILLGLGSALLDAPDDASEDVLPLDMRGLRRS